MRKQVIFELSAFEDFTNWAKLDRQIYQKIIALIKQIVNSSFTITQKGEPLTRELIGYWSIKISEEHRLVYKETKTQVIIASCKYHYV